MCINASFKGTAAQHGLGPSGATLGDTKSLVAEIDVDETVNETLSISDKERPAWTDADRQYQAARTQVGNALKTVEILEDKRDACTGNCSDLETELANARDDYNGHVEQRDFLKRTRDSITRYQQTGANISFEAEGEFGVEVEYSATSGTIDPFVQFAATVDAPDEVEAGAAFTLVTSAEMENGEIRSEGPGFEVTIDQVANISVNLEGEACAGVLGCVTVSESFSEDARAEVLKIDEQEVSFFQGYIDATGLKESLTVPIGDVTAEASVVLLPAPGISASVSGASGSTVKGGSVGVAVDLGSITISAPEVEVLGRLQPGGVVIGDASDTIVDMNLDVDTMMPLLTTGGSLEIGPVSVALDLLDIKAGPTLDLIQSYTMESDLLVNLSFDKAVQLYDAALGTWRDATSYIGSWLDLPAMKLYEDTLFTPLFSTKTMMTSKMGLGLGMEATVSLFKGAFALGPVPLEFGPLFEEDFNFAVNDSYISLFDETFEVAGLGAVQGDPFWIRTASQGPGNNPYPNPNPSPVPLPASVMLLLAGLAPLVGIRRLRKA